MIGAAWAVIGPLVTMLVFAVIFGRIAELPSDGTAPYRLIVYAGMLPWTFFSTGLSEAFNSLTTNANLISKVYFPRLIAPTATVVVAFLDLPNYLFVPDPAVESIARDVGNGYCGREPLQTLLG